MGPTDRRHQEDVMARKKNKQAQKDKKAQKETKAQPVAHPSPSPKAAAPSA